MPGKNIVKRRFRHVDELRRALEEVEDKYDLLAHCCPSRSGDICEHTTGWSPWTTVIQIVVSLRKYKFLPVPSLKKRHVAI